MNDITIRKRGKYNENGNNNLKEIKQVSKLIQNHLNA